MSNVGEIVVVNGSENLNENGWSYCTFWDVDADGHRFLNHEVGNWVDGCITTASENNELFYFDNSEQALNCFFNMRGRVIDRAMRMND